MKRASKTLLLALLLAAALVLGTWLATGYNGWAGKTCYALLCPLGVDTWFPAETVVELSPDSREADLAHLEEVCIRLVDIDWRFRVEEDADGQTARVKVRTWHPARSRRLAAEIRKEYYGGLWEMPLPEGWRVEGPIGDVCRALEEASRQLDPEGRGLRFELSAELAEQPVKMEPRGTFRDAARILAEIAPLQLQAVFCGDTAILAQKGFVARPAVFALEAVDAETGEPVPGARVANRWGLGAWTQPLTQDGDATKMCLLYVPVWRASLGERWLDENPGELEAEIEAEGYAPAPLRFRPELHSTAHIPLLRAEMHRSTPEARPPVSPPSH